MSDKTHLIFELSETNFRISEINKIEVKVLTSILFNTLTEKQIVADIQKAISETTIDSDYDYYSLVYVSNKFTLVPQTIFKASDIGSIYKASFSNRAENTDLETNIYPEKGIVTIYEIPLVIKRFFTATYPKIVVQHVTSFAIQALLAKSNQETSINLFVYPDYAYLYLISNQELLVANSFEYTNEDDLLYYISFSLKQNNLFDSKGNISLIIFDEASNLNELFFEKWNYIKNVSLIKNKKTFINLPKLIQSCV